MGEKIYNNEDIERILRRALNKNSTNSGGISESDLFRIASELNISRDQVLQAIREDSELAGYEEARRIWIQKKRSSFKEHLMAYLIINGFLVGINLFTLGNLSWALFPIMGWGIGLAFDYQESYHSSEEKIDEGARKLMKSKKWKNLFENFGFKILEELQKK